MDLRKFNGSRKGENRNAGRKPKASELELIERLSPLDEVALNALSKGVQAGEFQYIKLYFEYRFGKPKPMFETEEQNKVIKVSFVRE